MNKYKQFVEETGQLARMTTWDYHNKLNQPKKEKE